MKIMQLYYVCIGIVMVVMFSQLAQGQALPQGFATGSKGTLHVMDISVYPIHYDNRWQWGGYTVDDAFGNVSNIQLDGWQFNGQLHTGNNIPLNLLNTIHSDDASVSIDWQINATAAQPVPTNILALCFDMPVSSYAGQVVMVDDKPVTLTAEASTQSQVLPVTRNVQKIVIPTSKGPVMLTGKWDMEIVDRRRWKSNVYSLRLYFAQHNGKISQTNLKVKIDAQGYTCFPLSFEDQCNMGFKDDRAGDQVGGWSDQGSDNDLAAMKSGKKVYGGITMNIIDPAKNLGKSCMVFDCANRPYFLKQARVNVPNDQARKARTLFVLHSTAWGNHAGTEQPISVIKAHFTDGSTQDLPVMFGRELGDWWAANSKPNGLVVWSAPNAQAFVGAYLSRFQLPEGKTLDYFTLHSNQRCVWGVFAMTLCAQDAPLPSEKLTPLIITEGNTWKKLNWTQEVEPGSVLDFTSQYPQDPVGTWGHLRARNGHFEFEKKPGVPVRLHGANLCFESCYLEHEDAARLAQRLQMLGFNLVRLHHFDRGVLDAKADNSHTLDAQRFDKLSYLIAQLKQRGIYITWDLYTFREFRAEDSVLNRKFFREIKPLILVDAKARKALTDFAQVFLTTPNPYTGMPLASDPVLATTSTMNEDFLLGFSSAYPDVAKLHQQAYAAWLAEHHYEADAADRSSPLFTRFIYETATTAHRALQDALRQMGLSTPFTADNAEKMLAANLLYDSFDYVDNHFYHDHPAFVERGWSLPYAFSCASSTRQLSSALRMMFPIRRLDKPYSITEYNYVMPNPYRAESGPLMGAYAALQDWSQLTRFQYGAEKPQLTMHPGIMRSFSIANDPMNLMAERITSLMFRRGDVAKAQHAVAYVVDEQDLFTQGKDRTNHPSDYAQLGLITGVGTVTKAHLSEQLPGNCIALVGDEKLADTPGMPLPFIPQNRDILGTLEKQQLLSAGLADIHNNRFTSDTGQIQISANAGTFTVVTPRSEAMVLADKGSLVAGLMRVEDVSGAVTMFVAAMDDKPLASSGRMLLMHLTNALNTQMKFRDQQGRILEQWGKLPLLVKKGTANVLLALDQPEKVKVYAIDLAGKRLAQIPATVNDRKQLVFKADTFGCKDDGVLAYELVR
jgi:hypothetical protein